jgi:hypothetical protein
MLGFDLGLAAKYRVLFLLFSASNVTSSISAKLGMVDLPKCTESDQDLTSGNMLLRSLK